ncbi:hypothetical protein EI94DRAFT_1699736 [Lactarius quietus]|nr:hypothetical protein EI94DRAFT_1699736 [Lactarius quietus]
MNNRRSLRRRLGCILASLLVASVSSFLSALFLLSRRSVFETTTLGGHDETAITHARADRERSGRALERGMGGQLSMLLDIEVATYGSMKALSVSLNDTDGDEVLLDRKWAAKSQPEYSRRKPPRVDSEGPIIDQQFSGYVCPPSKCWGHGNGPVWLACRSDPASVGFIDATYARRLLKIDLEGWEFDVLTTILLPNSDITSRKPQVPQVSRMLPRPRFPDLLNWWSVLEHAVSHAVAREQNRIYKP